MIAFADRAIGAFVCAAMLARGQLPGVVRVGRRVLVREADLLKWLRHNTCGIAGEERR